VLTG
jgi:hypothetical protein